MYQNVKEEISEDNMPNKYAELRETEIFRVDPRETFYHGTKEPEFDNLSPGSSITPEWEVASNYAERGSWFGRTGEIDGRPGRVASYQVDLPEGAPLVGIAPEFTHDINKLTSPMDEHAYGRLKNRDDWTEADLQRERDRRSIYQEWHQEADDQTRSAGHPAYFTPFYFYGRDEKGPYTGRDSGLVVLDPEIITTQSHHASEPPTFVRGRVHLYEDQPTTPWIRNRNYHHGSLWERTLDGIPVRLEKSDQRGPQDWILTSDHPEIRRVISEHGNLFKSDTEAFNMLGNAVPNIRSTYQAADTPIIKLGDRHPGWVYSEERDIFVRPQTKYDPDNDMDLHLMDSGITIAQDRHNKSIKQLQEEFHGIDLDASTVAPLPTVGGQYQSLKKIQNMSESRRGRGRLRQ